MNRYLCIHGHFYQPPRENPWLEEVELQDSARPYHDWNERITAECYAPNAASRILDSKRRIVDIVNNYSRMSFNYGPTLLSWLERHRSDVYQAIVEADHTSRERFSGHGAALAQVYNHMIMPLASPRDKHTQVIWGTRDFRKRFGRVPEGMWLPETAVDVATLEVLAEHSIAFTVLAPHQAARVRRTGEKDWSDVHGGHIDPTMGYLCRLPSGRKIDLFFYDGPISRDVAFSGLLANGENFAARLVNAYSDERDWPQIVHIATDGETYGHHHWMGDMALAYCLDHIEANQLARVTIYGEYLDHHPPTHEVEIVEKSSWSCIHGIERWRDNCGCNSGMHPGWDQAWRRPLRDALNQLRNWLAPFFEHEAAKYLKAPWEARNDYIEVILDRSIQNVDAYLSRHALRELSHDEKCHVLRLMEMQRHAMLAFTSCGWFFDEISGIETTQVLRYADRALQLAEEVWGIRLEPYYQEILQEARSNIPEFGDGAKVYEMFVKPSRVDLPRVGAHYAISSIFEENHEKSRIFCYTAESELFEHMDSGALKLGIGRARIVSTVTFDERVISFLTLQQGGHEVTSGIREAMSKKAFDAVYQEVASAFKNDDAGRIMRIMGKHFGSSQYTLWHLFKDEQYKVLNGILSSDMVAIEGCFDEIVERNYTLLDFFNQMQMPAPKPLAAAAEFVLNLNLRKVLEQEDPDLAQLEKLAAKSKRWSIPLDAAELAFVASARIDSLMSRVAEQPENISLLETIERLFKMLKHIGLDLNLWNAQNIYFSLARDTLPAATARSEAGDDSANRWIEAFQKLSDHLQVNVM